MTKGYEIVFKHLLFIIFRPHKNKSSFSPFLQNYSESPPRSAPALLERGRPYSSTAIIVLLSLLPTNLDRRRRRPPFVFSSDTFTFAAAAAAAATSAGAGVMSSAVPETEKVTGQALFAAGFCAEAWVWSGEKSDRYWGWSFFGRLSFSLRSQAATKELFVEVEARV